MPFKIGDKVLLATHHPTYSYRDEAVFAEVGTISRLHHGDWKVDFPSHKGFFATNKDLMLGEGNKPIGEPPQVECVMSKPPGAEEKWHMHKPTEPSLETKAIISQWHLDKTLNLENLAADFYTLIDLQCDRPDEPKINKPLAKLTELLATQFSAYLDMVIGGELRHAFANAVDYMDDYGDCQQYESINAMPISKTAKDILSTFAPYGDYKGRNYVWKEWQGIRKKLGFQALRAAVEIFKLKWEDGYGGESWARATGILIDYLEGGLSATAFVDTCFGLHHNNNIILDKVWLVTLELKRVLDYNLDNKMDEVAEHCSPQVEKIVRRFRKP